MLSGKQSRFLERDGMTRIFFNSSFCGNQKLQDKVYNLNQFRKRNLHMLTPNKNEPIKQ